MKREDIVIGMRCRIRSWEDISSNCPKWDGFENIWYCPDDPHAAFVKDMIPLCGMSFTVKNVRNSMSNGEFFFLDSEEGVEYTEDWAGIGRKWDIAPWMLEEADDPVEERSDDLFSALFGEIAS